MAFNYIVKDNDIAMDDSDRPSSPYINRQDYSDRYYQSRVCSASKYMLLLDNIIKQEKGRSYYDWLFGYYSEHKRRIERDLERIQAFEGVNKILEVGSLPCLHTVALKEIGYKISGLDLEPERMSEFISKYKLRVLKCNIESERFPFAEECFDLVIFNETFEHLGKNPFYALREINRVLKKDGILMLSTPNLYSIGSIISFLLGRGFNDPVEELDKVNKYGHMGHIRIYSHRELEKMLRVSGFKIVGNYNDFYAQNRTKKILYTLLPAKKRPFQTLISSKQSDARN
jgi:SAM-dependent methyltransferase